jgi:hypothetical protein
MSSIAELIAEERRNARRLAANAAWLAYENGQNIHYTQGRDRWEGIDNELLAYDGEYPTHADASSFVTWCLWSGLGHYEHHDTVHEQDWQGGWTGSMAERGQIIRQKKNILRGDCVIYGAPEVEHVAIIVAKQNGALMVMSHGSESGPSLLRWTYRMDAICVRRYI